MPIDVLVDGCLGVILEQNPSPANGLGGIDEHPLSTCIPVFLGLFRDLVLVVQDHILFGGVLLAVRVDGVEARPRSLCHNFAQGCGSVQLRSVVFVVHSSQHFLCAQKLLLGKRPPDPIDGDGAVVLNELGVDPRRQRFRDGVLVGLCRRRCRRR